MSSLCLSLLFLLQGIPVQQGGKVSGVLRDNMGMPLAGVRIAAVSRGDTVEAAAAGVAMAGLAETDAQGRFTLEDIPPGRYAIAAGRLDQQTYYPGTQSLADARVLTVTAGETITGINFVLGNSSFGRSPGGIMSARATATIPVRVITQDGAKLPVWTGGGAVAIRLESTTLSVPSIPIDGTLFSIPGPARADVRVVVDNLPETHEVKSITYGASDITRGTFRLSDANFTTIPNAAVTSSLSTISITIGPAKQRSVRGVRITGRTERTNKPPIYISGRPGVLYSDGSFEFRGVAPGLQLIAAVSLSKPMIALVNVGNRDLDGVELQDTLALPGDVRIPKDPLPSGKLASDSVVPLPRVRGVVVEETSKLPIVEGQVEIRAGSASRKIAIDADGRFETFPLLPGQYDFRIHIFGHSSSGPMVTIKDEDLTIELISRRLY